MSNAPTNMPTYTYPNANDAHGKVHGKIHDLSRGCNAG